MGLDELNTEQSHNLRKITPMKSISFITFWEIGNHDMPNKIRLNTFYHVLPVKRSG